MDEKIKELKKKFEGSNKFILTLSYEDIKELFAIIEVLKNKEPIFINKELYNPKIKEIEKYENKIEETIQILEATHYEAYTRYCEILQKLKDFLKEGE